MDLLKETHSLITSRTTYILVDNINLDKCLIVEEDDQNCIIHIYSDEAQRGKALIEFVDECKEWARENKNYEDIINYVEVSDRPLKFLMRYLGSKPTGIIKDIYGERCLEYRQKLSQRSSNKSQETE